MLNWLADKGNASPEYPPVNADSGPVPEPLSPRLVPTSPEAALPEPEGPPRLPPEAPSTEPPRMPAAWVKEERLVCNEFCSVPPTPA